MGSGYGGVKLATQLFASIDNLYDRVQMRYHLCRNVPFAALSPIEANLPIGYLLNLSVKHVSPPSAMLSNPNSVLFSIMKRATALVACLSIQPQSRFEYTIADPRSLPDLLQKIAIYDANFTLFQMRPADVSRFIRALFDWVDESKCRERVGFTPSDAAVFADELLQQNPQSRQPVTFLAESLNSVLPEHTLNSLLDFFSHESQANRDFLSPTQSEEVDFWFRPLLKDNLLYTLLNKSWCAPAFYEAMCIALRQFEPSGKITEEIGLATERFLHGEIEMRGITVHSGKYNMNGTNSECDAVIETDQGILLLEMKAKALTRAARSGKDARILIDLAESAFASQFQVARHHRVLLEQGYIDLQQESGDDYRLELRGRKVERISITLLDFGGFQDREILHNLLSILTSTRYSPVDPGLKIRFQKLNTTCEKLSNELTTIGDICDQRLRHTLMSSWFLSVPQLLIILDDVTDAQSLWEALMRTRHVTTGSLDFYFEYAQAKKLRLL